MKYAFAVLSILIFFTSCKKENSPQGSDPTEDFVLDYMPLTVGNYWIYQRSSCDSGEVNCEEITIDTNWIIKDSLINDHLYYNLVGKIFSGEISYFLRDSGDYIVDLKGDIYFTHSDSTNTFNFHHEPYNDPDTLYYWYYQLTQNQFPVEVHSGIYECLDFRGHFFRHQDEFNIDHNTHKLFAKNVGMVKTTGVYASNLKVLKQELIGFHIEPDGGVTP